MNITEAIRLLAAFADDKTPAPLVGWAQIDNAREAAQSVLAWIEENGPYTAPSGEFVGQSAYPVE